MFIDSKYSKILTVLLVVVIIGIVGLLGFLGYEMYTKYFLEEDTQAFMEEEFRNNTGIKPLETNNVVGDFNSLMDVNSVSNTSGNGGTGEKKFKGFDVLGAIEIPKTNVDLLILKQMGTKAMNTSVVQLYGPGPNQVGNTVIAGHNYRNGQFFSNNYKLQNGDIIYITDNAGNKLKYEIYNKYETTPEDSDYMERNTDGKPEISLTTCTDDSKARIIIWARLVN